MSSYIVNAELETRKEEEFIEEKYGIQKWNERENKCQLTSQRKQRITIVNRDFQNQRGCKWTLKLPNGAKK